MLADQRRVQAFRRILAVAVSPGDVVVDIGTGTGLLALLAVGAGASRVYAIERGDVIDLAQHIARQNRVEDRVTFVRGDSREVQIPETADLVMGELIGSLGLDEQILSIWTGSGGR